MKIIAALGLSTVLLLACGHEPSSGAGSSAQDVTTGTAAPNKLTLFPAGSITVRQISELTEFENIPTSVTYAFVKDRPAAKDGADSATFDAREHLDVSKLPGARTVPVKYDSEGSFDAKNLDVELAFDPAPDARYLVYRIAFQQSSQNARYIDIKGGLPRGKMLLVPLNNSGGVGDGPNFCPQSRLGQLADFRIRVKSFTYQDHGHVNLVFYGYADPSVSDDPQTGNAKSAAWSDASGNQVREGDLLNGGALQGSEGDGTSGSESISPGFVWVPEGKQLIYRMEYDRCDGQLIKDPAVYVGK